MKKVLLAGTALLGVAFLSTPASAELKLDLGGYFRGYGVYADNDEPAGTSLRSFEFRRDTELHVNGETTLDNGLTVGFHQEIDVDGTTDLEDESYAYFSGQWGRVNFGSEDGAAYLLQVAAPSADSNIDGLRQYISGSTVGALDYDHADFRQTDRLTYLTPKFNGFQAGVSYAPNAGQQDDIALLTTDDDLNEFEDLWEVAARWDGEFYGFGTSIGAGYSTSDVESSAGVAIGDATDGIDTWNVGASLGWNAFTIGGSYSETETAGVTAIGPIVTSDLDTETFVVGAAWDNGPYHVGVSYLDTELEVAGVTAEADRTTVGAGYTYGPGMTFRGAVAFGDVDDVVAADRDFTQVTVGTDIQF